MDLFGSYAAGATRTDTYDEMYATSEVRPLYQGVLDKLLTMSQREVRGRADALASAYLDQGVTFAIGGEERPFPLDIMPRLIEPAA